MLQQTLLEGAPLLMLLLLRLLLVPYAAGQMRPFPHDCEAWLLLLAPWAELAAGQDDSQAQLLLLLVVAPEGAGRVQLASPGRVPWAQLLQPCVQLLLVLLLLALLAGRYDQAALYCSCQVLPSCLLVSDPSAAAAAAHSRSQQPAVCAVTC